MARIIPFPVIIAARYPLRTIELSSGEPVFLLAARWWMESRRQRQDPSSRLRGVLEPADALRAIVPVDCFMSLIVQGMRRVAGLLPPFCPELHDDEASLLHAAALAQAGANDLAERCLRTTLLSAHGAELAVPYLVEMSEIFMAVRLFFPRRSGASGAAGSGRPGEHQATMH